MINDGYSRRSYRDRLVVEARNLDPLVLLRSPVQSLLGVSDAARSTLERLGVSSVLDLAACPAFASVSEIAGTGRGSNAIAALGTAPRPLLDEDATDNISEVLDADLSVMRDIDDDLARDFRNNLQISKVSDLARWGPFQTARIILDEVSQNGDGAREEGSELLPRLGEYPVERNYYQTTVIDSIPQEHSLTDLTKAGRLDIAPIAGQDYGFDAPAVGARLTFAQTWYVHGITLGDLLHSVALAPGESTRIAILDWSRQTGVQVTEDTTETEQLTNVTEHNRALSEVQSAVADEVQSGFSKSSSTSSATGGGFGFGFSLGPVSVGASASGGETNTKAEAFTASFGSRSLGASLSQQVMDATRQAASSIRGRRASVVKEISETEQETVSTRIIANYNHMHALTVQYFEVVELYRSTVELHRVERCLFVPMRIVDFTDDVIGRYRGVLAGAALNKRIRELLATEYGMIRVSPSVPMGRPRPPSKIPPRPLLSGVSSTLSRLGVTSEPKPAPERESERPVDSWNAWDSLEMARIARVAVSGVLDRKSNEPLVPGDAELLSISSASSGIDGGPITSVSLLLHDGTRRELTSRDPDWLCEPAVPLRDVEAVSVSTVSDSRYRTRLSIVLEYQAARLPLSFPIDIAPHVSHEVVCRFKPAEIGPELRLHLDSNRLHYSQAIWRSLDTAMIALLLSAYTFEGRPLGEQVDPNPIMIGANYIVFRMPGFSITSGLKPSPDGMEKGSREAAAWSEWMDWLQRRGLDVGSDVTSEALIALPSGGVFAEAVLGRSNAAEKLDATRFWNWQDSPIPLQPPEVAAIQLGSRAREVDASTPQLGQPVLNIVNPTALPEPTSLSAILQAMQAGTMFRDMSGLAASIELARATTHTAGDQATNAGQVAAANLAVAAQKDIEEKKIAAQLALAAMGMPAASGSPSNISEMGALINTAKEHDAEQRRLQALDGGSSPDGPVGTTGSQPGGAGGSATSSGRRLEGGGSNASPIPAVGGQAIQRALWGPLGKPAASVISEGNRFVAGSATSKPLSSVQSRAHRAHSAIPTGHGMTLEIQEDGKVVALGSVVFSNFDVNDANLKPEFYPALDRLADALALSDSARGWIEGHASQTGEESWNLELSEQRAASINDHLVFALGMAPSTMIDVYGVGSLYPLTDRRGIEEPLNRSVRVAWSVLLPDVVKTSPPPPRTANAFTRWKIRLVLSGGAGHSGIGGAFAIGQIMNAVTGEVRQGSFTGGGIGVGLQSPGGDPGWGDWTEFTTDPVGFEDFDRAICRLTMAGVGISVLGYSATWISFPLLGANSIYVGGWNLGAVGADASTNTGVWNVLGM